MDNGFISDKIELQELANKLFMYVDAQHWDKLLEEVFTEDVWFDMESAGGGAARSMDAEEICAIWKKGFTDLDAVHHQAGHYLIDVAGGEAAIFAYAIASHFKQNARNGNIRTFVGSYDLKAIKTASSWRLNQFKYAALE